mgnify:CR=1 FL=1
MFTVFKLYQKELFFGTLAAVTTFVLFYLMSVFTLSWATTDLGFSRRDFLIIQLFSVLFFMIAIPVSALLADRFGRRLILVTISLLIAFLVAIHPLFIAYSQEARAYTTATFFSLLSSYFFFKIVFKKDKILVDHILPGEIRIYLFAQMGLVHI